MPPKNLHFLFAVWAILVAIWLPLISWLFRRLRTRHPETYEAIGSPGLIQNSSLQNNWRFLKFMWSSRPDKLKDGRLSITIWLMRLFLICYVVLFAWIAVGVLTVRS